MSVSTSTGTASIPSTVKDRARTSKRVILLGCVCSGPGESNRCADGVAAGGGGAPLPCEIRSLGYPRSRKNGGQSEAGTQPYWFTARRATNGAPPSEATQPNGSLFGYGDPVFEPVREAERLFPRLGSKRRRTEAVPVVQAEEAGGVLRKVGTRPHRGGQGLFEGLPRGTPEPVSIEAANEARVRAGKRREAGPGSVSPESSP